LAQSVVASGVAMRSAAETQTVTYYDMWSNITNARGTSWTVGLSVNGTSGWSIGGSSTFDQSTGVGMVDHFNSGGTTLYRHRVEVQLNQVKIRWSCASQTSPGPYILYTSEATSLTGGHTHTTGSTVGCNGAYKVPIGPGSSTNRTGGSKSTNQFNAGLWGFTGGQTATYATYTSFSWTNQSVYQRSLCGESGLFSGSTRVSAVS
jgi:hypothetical protein